MSADHAADLASRIESWTPQPVTDGDPMSAAPAAALAAVLGDDAVFETARSLPPLWHWLYFLDWPRHRELGADGHPTTGHFYPPIPDRRRMVAGGRVWWHAPLRIGQPAERIRSLTAVEVKRGRSGEMVFVTVRSEISQRGSVAVIEEQDIVYRSGEGSQQAALDPAGARAGVPTSTARWQRSVRTDERLLFRFSALTANAHRIHYDAPYAVDVERYPGLVVHGPLLVLLMARLLRTSVPAAVVAVAEFRLRRPLFVGEPLLVTGNPDGATAASLAIASTRDDRHATMAVTLG